MAVLRLSMPHLVIAEFLSLLNQAPNSSYLRIIGFLYEAFTGNSVGRLPPSGGAYANVFDPNLYYTGKVVKNSRWRVNFNGIGSTGYCPVVRRTAELDELQRTDILTRVEQFFAETEPTVLDRALSWAYLSETEGTYALERESPAEDKKAIFVRLLQQAHEPREMTEDYLVALQNSAISNPFDLAAQYRTEQNWLRKRGLAGPAGVSYVPPKPDDVLPLMSELLALLNARPAEIDPIMLGGIAAFGFVFIHPFMDGNGRLSRFLMHYALCQSGRLPKGLMLPISVAMKRNEREYLDALVGFSRPTRAFWRVSMLDQESFLCETDASDAMYRYWDATDCITFIYRMALNTLQNDLAHETQYLVAFDAAYKAIDDIADIRNDDLNNLIMWCVQNAGKVSKNRREQLGYRYRPEVFDTIEYWVSRFFHF